MKKAILLIVFTTTVVIASPTFALMVYLTETNESSLGTANFASVNVEVSGGVATFTVDPDPDDFFMNLGTGYGANFGIQDFYFNTSIAGLNADNISFIGLIADAWGVNYNQNASEYGTFNIWYKGSGGTRQNPLKFQVQSAITNPISITSDQQFYVENVLGYHYAAHIADFDGDGFTSAKFADGELPVPEPATMLLLGVGLVGLAGIGRKKFMK